jgi:periplasmic protein CpxP/Spy
MSDQSSPSGRSGGGRTITLVVVALVAALAGAAVAHIAPFAMGHHGWHHGHRFGHEAMSPADLQTHVDRMVGHFARHADATAEQQTKIAAIAKAAATELLPLHQQFFEAHKKALELLRQPAIDRAALEALRAEQIARADAASKRLLQALADVAGVLTPEQRARIADRFDHDD